MANFKSAILKSKQIIITNDSNTKQHGLKERAFHFAERVHEYIKRLPRFITNNETGRQLARSSGSIGANYIEANESLSKKDFKMRVKICKKEVKETRYWLRLSEPAQQEQQEKENLIDEVTQLMKIFGSIVEKCK